MSHRRERRKNAGSKVKKFHSAQRAAGSGHGPREMHPDAISDACVPINASVRIPVKPGPKLTHLPDGCRRAFSRRFVPPVFSAFQSTQTRHLRKQFFLSRSESHLSGLPSCFCPRSSCRVSLSSDDFAQRLSAIINSNERIVKGIKREGRERSPGRSNGRRGKIGQDWPDSKIGSFRVSRRRVVVIVEPSRSKVARSHARMNQRERAISSWEDAWRREDAGEKWDVMLVISLLLPRVSFVLSTGAIKHLSVTSDRSLQARGAGFSLH